MKNCDIMNITTIVIKREDSIQSQPSPMPTSRPPSILSDSDVKHKLLDSNPQMSAASDHSSMKQDSIKEDLTNATINDAETVAKRAQGTASEMKRRRSREYQKNRRQMPIQSKENANNALGVGQGPVKKEARKMSSTTKIHEDYDT